MQQWEDIHERRGKNRKKDLANFNPSTDHQSIETLREFRFKLSLPIQISSLIDCGNKPGKSRIGPKVVQQKISTNPVPIVLTEPFASLQEHDMSDFKHYWFWLSVKATL